MTKKLVNGILEDLTSEEQALFDANEAQAVLDHLERTRANVVQSIKVEGLNRIAAYFPEMTDIDQLATIWRAIESTARSVALTSAKAVYDEAKVQIAWANDPSRTQAELDNYNPVTDPTWP